MMYLLRCLDCVQPRFTRSGAITFCILTDVIQVSCYDRGQRLYETVHSSDLQVRHVRKALDIHTPYSSRVTDNPMPPLDKACRPLLMMRHSAVRFTACACTDEA